MSKLQDLISRLCPDGVPFKPLGEVCEFKRGQTITEKDYALFQNAGYEGMYAGMTKADIYERKGLGKSQDLLSHMGSTELAANLFRATQTEEKLRKEGIKGKENANKVHKQVGAKVRKAIKDIGGTMPEDLPVADSIKKLERKEKKLKKLTGNTRKEEEQL